MPSLSFSKLTKPFYAAIDLPASSTIMTVEKERSEPFWKKSTYVQYNDRKYYRCSSCDDSFPTRLMLWLHNNKNHTKAKENKVRKILCCLPSKNEKPPIEHTWIEFNNNVNVPCKNCTKWFRISSMLRGTTIYHARPTEKTILSAASFEIGLSSTAKTIDFEDAIRKIINQSFENVTRLERDVNDAIEVYKRAFRHCSDNSELFHMKEGIERFSDEGSYHKPENIDRDLDNNLPTQKNGRNELIEICHRLFETNPEIFELSDDMTKSM